LCAQLTRDLFAIAKFLLYTKLYGNIPTGTPPNEGVQCMAGMKKLRFSTNISLYLGNDAR